MKKHLSTRVLSLLLVVVMLVGFAVPVQATHTHETAESESLSFEKLEDAASLDLLHEVEETEEESLYADTDIVRVSIVLDKESTIEAGFAAENIAANAEAMTYRQALKTEQETMTSSIETAIGGELDVQWNLTLAANIISANVEYGQIEKIEAVPGVQEVFVEMQYEPAVVEQEEELNPNMATSGEQIGSTIAWANGYTGAGSRIAVIDTGIDSDHQSFSATGFEYALAQNAAAEGVDLETYKASLDLLDAEEIATLLPQLNVYERTSDFTAEQLNVNSKIAFGYNYIDKDLDIVHDNDSQGSHGSHVTGIATANTYIPNEDGTFSKALDTVFVQGVAPDAQIITLKVFGKGGGAYEADYMAAIEDAIILGADAVNLSLGSTVNGFITNSPYQELLDSLAESGTVATISASNAATWAEYTYMPTGHLTADDINFFTGGSPGTYTNSLSVASVDNVGQTGYSFRVGEKDIFYNQKLYTNLPMYTIGGEHEYVFIDGIGTEEDWAAVGDTLKGKIAICSRGNTSFFQKAEAAVAAGAIATVIYNNTTGTINMDLSSYTKTEPCVSITQEQGAYIKSQSTAVTDEEGNALYYTGKISVGGVVAVSKSNPEYYTMSTFSSWGVPSALILKPEITAPGGNIYSINGLDTSGKAYENNSGTSMAAPQVAGMTALVMEYIRENNLTEKTGLTARQLAQSLLMSTSVPLLEEASGGNYWSVLVQGSGLANVGNAITANSYILMGEDATASYADGKVKAELGDDPERKGEYTFNFTINNMTDSAKTYNLSADFFTQAIVDIDGTLSLDTCTTPVAARTSYLVDGVEFISVSRINCDLDGDGDTDADDAQIILNYTVGLASEIASIADVNKDGVVNTYDAHLILRSLETTEFTVPASGKVTVTVKVALPESVKTSLNAQYVNGAYLEGYVFVNPTSTTEGEITDVTHSIPVLGFYGSWTDASMFDKGRYVDRLYGDKSPTYLNVKDANSLSVKYEGETSSSYVTGNPYFKDESYPAERVAVGLNTKLATYKVSLIRNAAALATYVMNQDGELLFVSGPSNNVYGAYYSTTNASWGSLSTNPGINRTLERIGAEDGDVVTVGVVAIPEYYAMNGNLSVNDIKEMINSGVLGDGAFTGTSVLVDGIAPELLDVSKSMTNNAMTITACDNNYIAAIQVSDPTGETVYYSALPEQTEKNETVNMTIDLTELNVGKKFTITVADYAGNKTSYLVTSNNSGEEEEIETYPGSLMVWSQYNGRGNSKRMWMALDLDTLWWKDKNTYTGSTEVYKTDYEIYAAEYADGYVYYAADDGYMYVCKQGDWEETQQLVAWSDVTEQIMDMAVSRTEKKMFVVVKDGTIYEMDLGTGKLANPMTITLVNPDVTDAERYDRYRIPASIAIDGEGRFYITSSGYNRSSACFLYTFTLNDLTTFEDAEGNTVRGINNLEPIDNAKGGNTGAGHMYYGPILDWNFDNDKLYMYTGYNDSSRGNNENMLHILDTTTGKIQPINDYVPEGETDGYSGVVGSIVSAMYFVPESDAVLPPANKASSVEVILPDDTVLLNSVFTAEALVGPWYLDDKSVTWSTSDESVAIVNEKGVVTTVGLGTVSIIATTVAEPHLQSGTELTVVGYPATNLTAAVNRADGSTYISEFSTSDLNTITNISSATATFAAGGYHDGKAYYHDNANMYSVDVETMEVTALSGIASSWQWSDAATMPLVGMDIFDKVVGLCQEGTYLELVTPEEGTLGYVSLQRYFRDDPMATIAYIGPTTKDHPGSDYYVLTEYGNLYYFSVYTRNAGNGASVEHEMLMSLENVDLTDVSIMGSGSYGSMIYDQETGYLLLSHTMAGDAAKLYAIDPVTGVVATIGTFSEDIKYVAGMYEFTRTTELTVQPSTTSVNLYTDETYDIDARVLPFTNDQGIVWSSSDTAVATVDQNGVVTPVAAGTATITATSVAVDAEGNPATAEITVTVEALMTASITFHAQITDATGTYWGKIDTSNMSVTKEGDANVIMTGAGVHSGKIYGTDSDYTEGGYLYQIDPSNSYTVSTGSATSKDYAYLDGASAPAMKTTGTKKDTGDLYDAYDYPVALFNSNIIGYIKDYVAGTMQGFNMNAYLHNAGAIANTGHIKNKNKYDAYSFYILENDGDIHELVAHCQLSRDVIKYYGNLTMNVANLGETFTNHRKLSMTYINDGTNVGLLIADSGTANTELYFVDLAEKGYNTYKLGAVKGVTELVGLYTDSEIAPPPAEEGAESVDTGIELEAVELSADTVELTDDISFSECVAIDADVAVAETSNEVATPNATTKSWTLSDTEDSTNGKFVVTYDPAQLDYTGCVATGAKNYAVNADETNGIITFSYASDVTITANTELAQLNFQYVQEYVNSTITIETKERNDEVLENVIRTIDILDEPGGHDYEVVDSKDATCTEDGYKDYVCTKCGETYHEVVKTEGHKYEANVTAPTCTEMGYTTYICSACQDTYVADYVNPKGHNYEAYVTAPTCTESGYTTYVCACGETYVSDFIDPVGHTFGEWETVTAPGCETKGQEKRTCECGETEYRDTDPTGHSYEAVVTEPTCTESGYTTYTCACGDSYVSDLTPAKGHNYEAVVTDPTCTESGYTTYTCVDCGDSYIANIVDPIAHDYEAVVVDPTCTGYGYTNHVCTVCGDSYATDYVPATGHTFGEWTLTKQETCTEAGEETRYCAVCDATETREIPAYCPAEDFSDLDTEQWYHEGVCFALRSGLMNGMSETVFAPNANMTRAQLVTVLYRLAGEPSVEGLENPFTDVAAGEWYTDAIIWAANEGIVNGMSKTVFAPGANISREQLVTILYRFNGETEVDAAVLEGYTDAANVSDWAAPAFAWAVENGIITGMTATTLAPQGNATRAQVATILMRYCENAD